MTSDFDCSADQITAAKKPEDLFGNCTNVQELNTIFKSMMQIVHPDRNGHSTQATQAAARLSELHVLAKSRMESGIYGIRSSIMTFSTRRHSYTIDEQTGTMGIANTFNGMMDDSTPVIFHITADPSTNDILKRESQAILKLRDTKEHGATGYHSMLPQFIESLDIPISGKIHRCNIYKNTLKGFVSLHDISKGFGASGISGKDIAWMLRRALDVIGYAHSLGIIHGGLNPTNIFIGTGDLHDVIIFNWQNACFETGDKVKFIEKPYASCVAPEVVAKQAPTVASDLYSIGKSFKFLCGTETSTRVSLFLQSFTIATVSQRPQSAFQMREEFTKMIRDLWGPPEYRPFYMNTKGNN